MAHAVQKVGRSQFASNLFGLTGNSEVFVGILTSRTIQDRIVDHLKLKQAYGTISMEGARRALATHVDISLERRSDMITITVTDHSPERAAAIANMYVTELNDLLVELSSSSARRERVFLEGFLDQVKQDLENAEKEFSEFASKNSTIDLNEQSKAMVGAAATLQGELISAQSELEAMRKIYSDSNVRVRAGRARIQELESQLKKFVGKEQGIGPYTGAAELIPSVRKLPLLGVTYADLYRQVKVQEAVYGTLTQEYSLAKVQEARDMPSVRALDPANIPEHKSFPPRLLIGISSMCLAFLSGLALVLGFRAWYDTDPQDLSRMVVTEIWLDLKEKRFLNPANGSQGPGTNSDAPMSKKRGILSFLGWSNAPGNGHGSYSASGYTSNRQHHEGELPGNNANS
jgi:capsule polysaccharide export protein KpsE/RkpR